MVLAELPAIRDGIDVADGLTAGLDELREISRGIHPAILSEGGLGPALRTLGRRSAVPVQLDIESYSRYLPSVEVAAYYVVSEALTNTAKHANASQADVVVGEDNGTLRLRVSDNGVGGRSQVKVLVLLGSATGSRRWAGRSRSPVPSATAEHWTFASHRTDEWRTVDGRNRGFLSRLMCST